MMTSTRRPAGCLLLYFKSSKENCLGELRKKKKRNTTYDSVIILNSDGAVDIIVFVCIIFILFRQQNIEDFSYVGTSIKIYFCCAYTFLKCIRTYA